MPSKARHHLVSLILSLVLTTTAAVAQSSPAQIDPGNATGIVPYSPYGGVRENISYGTGNVALEIPLVNLTGRNGQGFPLTLLHDSKIWDLRGIFDSNTGISSYWWEYNADIGIGPRFNIPKLTATWKDITLNPNPNIAHTSCYTPLIFIDADGSKHSFDNRWGCMTTPPGGQAQRNSNADIPITDNRDASYMRLDSTNTDVVVYSKGGTRYHFTVPCCLFGPAYVQKIEDANGNIISFSYPNSGGVWATITDNVGRVVTISTLAGSTQTITFKDSNGATQTITLAYTTTALAPAFTQPVGAGPLNPQLVTMVTLPTNRNYVLQYNNFGEITNVTYPSGGYTRYEYGTFTAYHRFWGDVPESTPADFREIVAKHVCRDPQGQCSPASEDTITYAPTIDSGKMSNQYMDVRDPYGNRTRYELSYGVPLSSEQWAPRELFRYVYSGESTLLQKVETEYSPASAHGTDQLPIRRTITLADVSPNQVMKTEWDYDTINSVRIDNAVTERQYDYGSGVPGVLLRQTARTWLKTNTVNGQDYTSTSIHILDRMLTENVQDSGGSNFAQTKYEYDNYGSISPSGAVQHNSAFGTGYTTRGNATKVQKWRNTDGAWLATTSTYDDAGNILSTTAPSNAPYDSFTRTTSFSYADSWGNTVCTPTGGSGAAYITSVTNAAGQATTYKYNSCTGTMASLTDPNLKTTTFSFDLLARLTQTNYPDGGQTTNCYSDVREQPASVRGKFR